jgi:ABC-type multidrug transport system permease subunit
MKEILDVCIQSGWFWVAFYTISMCFAYFLSIKFNWWDEDDEDNIYNAVVGTVIIFPHFCLAIYIIHLVVSSIGRFISYLANADHLTKEESELLKSKSGKNA